MITAHLPSGYIVGRILPAAPLVLPMAILGGVFPDFDLIWFYLIDDRAIHHHRYWVHAPAFWVLTSIPTLFIAKQIVPKHFAAVVAFLVAIGIHILLDTIAGDIMWLWPFSNELFHLITVEAKYSHWILNFIFHPVFLLEILIWVCAGYLFFGTRNEQ